MSTLHFSLSAAMPPTGVALKLSMFKIIFCTKSSVTCWKINFSLISLFHLILSTLGWALITFCTSSKVFALLLLSLSSSKSLVILIKKLFIIVASCFLFETRFPFSLRKNLFQFDSLLLKYEIIVCQNILLSNKSLLFKFWKYSLLVLRSRFTQKFRCFL